MVNEVVLSEFRQMLFGIVADYGKDAEIVGVRRVCKFLGGIDATDIGGNQV